MPNSLFTSKIADLTIPNGAQFSAALNSRDHFGDAEGITIEAPAALDAGTYSIQVGDKLDGVNVNWVTLQLEQAAPADMPVPGAGKAITYSVPVWPCMRLACSIVQTADRIFKIYKVSRM